MSSEIVRRFRGISAEPYEGYQQAVLRVYGHLPEFQLYRDLSDAASHIEALEAENERLRGRVTNPMLVAGLVRADELGYKMQDWEVNAIILSALSQAKE